MHFDPPAPCFPLPLQSEQVVKAVPHFVHAAMIILPVMKLVCRLDGASTEVCHTLAEADYLRKDCMFFRRGIGLGQSNSAACRSFGMAAMSHDEAVAARGVSSRQINTLPMSATT